MGEINAQTTQARIPSGLAQMRMQHNPPVLVYGASQDIATVIRPIGWIIPLTPYCVNFTIGCFALAGLAATD
jgi:hypothetical protein